jgi:hypothetical protein
MDKMACVTSYDCIYLTDVCQNGVCDTDTDTLYIALGILGAFMVLTALIAWFFPIRDPDGNNMVCASVAMALFLPPIYFVVLGYQNPIKTGSGSPNYILTVLIAWFLPVILLFVIPRDGWKKKYEGV